MSDQSDDALMITPVTPPVQFDSPELSFDPEIERFIWAAQARKAFSVTGNGLTVAVCDTGLNVSHVDFAGRIIATRNFTTDDGGDLENATDRNGHGTNVTGLIAANADHTGIAPGVNIIPIKVLADNGSGSFQWIADALTWVLDNHEEHTITAVCMSLGDGGNYTEDDFTPGFRADLRKTVAKLSKARIAVCIAAGNDFFSHNSEEGMGFPAIIRECISVGAVYDAEEGSFSYGSGATATSSAPGQITPFSQRLHPKTNRATYTDIFAPGAPATSSGIGTDPDNPNPNGESTQHGTSQATPVTVGVVLLLQEYYLRMTGEMPTMRQLTSWLRSGGVRIYDGDDEADNVTNTERYYKRVDALSALDAARRYLQRKRLRDAVSAIDDE